MNVVIIDMTSWFTTIHAARKCYDSLNKSDSYFAGGIGSKDTALLCSLARMGHESVFEHKKITFDIDGISRACLQELVRHRTFAFSVKSTRYTLDELKDCENVSKFLVEIPDEELQIASELALEDVRDALRRGVPKDIAKMGLPENFKTSLVMTCDFRNLMNFLNLRLSSKAHYEIKELAEIIKSLLDPVAFKIYGEWRTN